MLVLADGAIGGYYTLSSTGVTLAELPVEITRRLPRYPIIPATLLGRLAVDQRMRGRSYGRFCSRMRCTALCVAKSRHLLLSSTQRMQPHSVFTSARTFCRFRISPQNYFGRWPTSQDCSNDIQRGGPELERDVPPLAFALRLLTRRNIDSPQTTPRTPRKAPRNFGNSCPHFS
ncbi:MAG: hypothetical protein WDN04_15915 [Rhodospirillales bacterium]